MLGDQAWVAHAFAQMASIMRDEGMGLDTTFSLRSVKEPKVNHFVAGTTEEFVAKLQRKDDCA